MTMRNKWLEEKSYTPETTSSIAHHLATDLSLSPLLAHLLTVHGIQTSDDARAYLRPDQYPPTLPSVLPDINRAIDILKNASSILIWGDFDVDGAAGAAVLFEGLTRVQPNTQVHIARYRGFNKIELTERLKHGTYDVLITTDTGSSAFSSIDYAKSLNIKVIVTDHHNLPSQLPSADALINPKRLSENHPLYHLSGVGVAYLVIQELYVQLGLQRHLTPLLDLLPLGLIGDMVDLVDDTRFLTQQGMAQLAKSARPGILALAAEMKVDLGHLSSEDVGFRLVPPLNAFGRIADPVDAFRLMTTRSETEARLLAVQANSYNQQRRLKTRQIITAAEEQIEKDPSLLTWSCLVLTNPHWDAGVLGAAAGQLAETYQRPVVLLVPDENEKASGSARSTSGYNITEALSKLDNLLLSYGGHESAAGLSLDMQNLSLFRRQFSNLLAEQRPPATLNTLQIDAILSFEQLTLELAQDLERLAPFGTGNPRPVIMTPRVQRLRSAKLGRDDQHRRLTIRDENGIEVSVFWWNSSDLEMPDGIFDLAYRIAPIFRDGEYEIQLTLVDWRQVEAPSDDAHYQPVFIDQRDSLNLDELKQREPSLMVWAEGYSQTKSTGLPLSELETAEALVIYTAPPHPDLLTKAIKAVHPQRVYVYAELPPFDTPQRLLEAVAALLRNAQEQFSGKIRIRQIAERTAHTDDTIREALNALGDTVEIHWLSGSSIRVIRAGQPPKIDVPALARLIDETVAYRRYLQRVDLENMQL